LLLFLQVQGLLLGLQLAGGRPGGSGLTVDKDTVDYWMKVRPLS
jgi:hypothetical protein